MKDNHDQIKPEEVLNLPEILAPAGGKKAFLAALSAGADAIYCGLKHFSARMASENFTIAELQQLTELAHEKGKKVYVAVNTLIKPGELDRAGMCLDELNRFVHPDAIIIQDLALLSLARQVKFSGEVHLSTLANVTFPEALKLIQTLEGVNRVVLPRELSIDEIKAMAASCPPGLSMEVFIHGALCYAVSGRCYWSSYMGGKSGLRGRCVQPCRRIYTQNAQKDRFFSCTDYWVDVLTKIVAAVPEIASLKIEGRKKGPHYVYYTVSAYRLLRDNPNDSKAKKSALALLEYSLGRKGTHYNFLSQRPQSPIKQDTQTGSGLIIGSVKGERSRPYIVPREELFKNDTLRIGYEDEPWHTTYRVSKYVPKRGKLFLKFIQKHKPKNGTQVFLVDRREPELQNSIQTLEKELKKFSHTNIQDSNFRARLPRKGSRKNEPREMTVYRSLSEIKFRSHNQIGLWLSTDMKKVSVMDRHRFWCWLPPVIWPDDQLKIKSLIKEVLKKGCSNFVLNAPWQMIFFQKIKKANLWAGPFCNIANELAIPHLADMGFQGIIISPELGKRDYASLPEKSLLPLGIVLSGNWPLCVSRIKAEALDQSTLFSSPKGEQAWVRQYGSDYWVFPNWKMDLTRKKETLIKSGYQLFVHLSEPIPKKAKMKKRQGLWNWEIGLK
jgi:putative protease